MSTSEILILRIVGDHGGVLPYHDLATELSAQFEQAHQLALSFGRRTALDTVYELGALGALRLGEDDEEDPELRLTAYGEQLIQQLVPLPANKV